MPETTQGFQPFLQRPSFYQDESPIAHDFIDIYEEDYPSLLHTPEEVERVLLYFDSLEIENTGVLTGGEEPAEEYDTVDELPANSEEKVESPDKGEEKSDGEDEPKKIEINV